MGPRYAENATILVQLLVVANIIRICVSPYIVAMIGTGEQRRIIFVPLLEGAVNLAASVIAGYYLGAAGVALGTLIGSVVSLVGHRGTPCAKHRDRPQGWRLSLQLTVATNSVRRSDYWNCCVMALSACFFAAGAVNDRRQSQLGPVFSILSHTQRTPPVRNPIAFSVLQKRLMLVLARLTRTYEDSGWLARILEFKGMELKMRGEGSHIL